MLWIYGVNMSESFVPGYEEDLDEKIQDWKDCIDSFLGGGYTGGRLVLRFNEDSHGVSYTEMNTSIVPDEGSPIRKGDPSRLVDLIKYAEAVNLHGRSLGLKEAVDDGYRVEVDGSVVDIDLDSLARKIYRGLRKEGAYDQKWNEFSLEYPI